MRNGNFFLKVIVHTLLMFPATLMAQKNNEPQTLLWKVKDPVSNHVSYLFGTNHIFGSSWLDSITTVKDKFLQSNHVFVELYQAKTDTNLYRTIEKSYKGPPVIPRKVFHGRYYAIVKEYVKSIGWGDLDNIFSQNNGQPILLWFLLGQLANDQAIRLQMIVPGEDNIDTYFAKQARSSGKLQSNLDDSVNIYNDLNHGGTPQVLAKQIGEYAAFLMKKKSSKSNESEINFDYVNLKSKYYLNKREPKGSSDGGLDRFSRNNLWMKKLNVAMRIDDCFIAVGFGHLKYKDGLINQLRKTGFEVTPVPMSRIKK